MTAVRNDIIQGPSKFDLMLALFDRKVNNPRHVDFKLSGGNVTTFVVINGVEVEDGSGENWIFKGYAKNATATDHQGAKTSSTCFGFYRTDTRKGWIEFVQ